jgi:hypothetical protein
LEINGDRGGVQRFPGEARLPYPSSVIASVLSPNFSTAVPMRSSIAT